MIRLKKKTCMLKRHYRALKNCMELEFQNFFLVCYNSIVQKSSFKLKLNFEKIEFQNRGISLISLGNGAKRWFFCTKRALAHFLREISTPSPFTWILEVIREWTFASLYTFLGLQKSLVMLLTKITCILGFFYFYFMGTCILAHKHCCCKYL